MATPAAENSVQCFLPTPPVQISQHEEEVDKQILFPQPDLVLFKSLVIATYMTLLKKFSVCNIYQESWFLQRSVSTRP